MLEFIYDLYQNDNFTLIITIAIILLVILFVVVLIFGKKDQKLEETKRLQKMEVNAFKSEKKEPLKIEAPKEEIKEELDVPEVEIVEDKYEATMTIIQPIKEEKETNEIIEEVSDTKEIIISNDDSFEKISEELEKDLTDLQQIKDEFSNIEIPKIEEMAEKVEAKEVEEEPKNSVSQNTQVFSSVYVPKQEEKETKDISIEDELPTKVASNIEDEDEYDFDLPTLKDENELKSEINNVPNLEDLVGEVYNIKK